MNNYDKVKETHEGIVIDDLTLNITGMVDGDTETRDPNSKMVYYFLVIEAQFEVEFFGKTYLADCSDEMIKKLNDDCSDEIMNQIKEG